MVLVMVVVVVVVVVLVVVVVMVMVVEGCMGGEGCGRIAQMYEGMAGKLS